MSSDTGVAAGVPGVTAGGSTDPQYVVVLGVVPGGDGQRVAGLPVRGLTDGDPYYADGSYDGRWTGEAVVSESAAESLAPDGVRLSTGAELVVNETDGERRFTVGEVAEAGGPGIGQLPVVVVHLGELQQLTGGTNGDVADQLLVSTDGSVTADELADAYPSTQVLTRGELLTSRAQSSGLPVAMAAAALIVTLVVGTLFLVTTVGFSVLADAESRAVLAAVGVSGRSRTVLVASETLATAGAGGLLGIGSWILTVVVVTALRATGTTLPFAARPVFGLYGLVVALGVGIIALPPLLLVSRRTRAVREVLR